MTEHSDTLDIGSLRLRKEYSVTQAQFQGANGSEKNPRGAAAARARIAALSSYAAQPEYTLGREHQVAPATPTADLIIDKAQLAHKIQAQQTPLVRRRRIPTIFTPILTAAGVFLLVLMVFKAPVMINQLQYNFGTKKVAPIAAIVPATEAIPAENTISIPKINVKAPVGYEPSIQETAIQRALQDGVVHYGNTALPGTAGNVAIFGHSSNDWWEPGNYKFVFVLLDKLAPGDQITMDYQSKRYSYVVTETKVVEPTNVSVLNATSTPTLTLITCSPPGTSLKRLVVSAKQVSPDPTNSQVAVVTPSVQAPAALATSPSFLDQLTQSFNGIFSFFGGGNAASNPAPSATSGSLPAVK